MSTSLFTAPKNSMNATNLILNRPDSTELVSQSRLSDDYEPARAATLRAQLRRYETLADTNTPLNVVIADDEKRLRDLIAISVNAMGHKVIGQGATTTEALSKTFELQPDLVIFDVVMPGGGNGIEAANIVANSLAIPAIVSTALTDSRTLAQVASSLIKAYLVKPFSPAQLKSAICVAIAQHRQELYARCRLLEIED
jgi:CheY-like chemotaxis protein